LEIAHRPGVARDSGFAARTDKPSQKSPLCFISQGIEFPCIDLPLTYKEKKKQETFSFLTSPPNCGCRFLYQGVQPTLEYFKEWQQNIWEPN